jgi:protein gp37
MHQTKVEWGDRAWSPITGCDAGCPYCNSKRTSRRFAGDIRKNKQSVGKYRFDGQMYVINEQFIADNGMPLSTPFGFEPTYHRYSAKRLETLKTPMNVLVCPNGEMFGEWVADKYIREIFDETAKYPDQRFFFQTKFPERYVKLSFDGTMPWKSDNCWFGYTVTNGTARTMPYLAKHKFVVIEPLLGPVADIPMDIEWVIVGADTGKYAQKVEPEEEWIKAIIQECEEKNIPLFMMDSLKDFYSGELKKEKPEILLKKRYSKAKEAMYFADCRVCGKHEQKRSMALIHAKYERKIYPYPVGYLCKECFKKMCKDYNLDYVEGSNGSE